ncbi:MAG: hypothetical protein IGR93_00935 [Hydrococcus sp. C42_A2020_068]|nr:hypothetical protein [Hydrococcus sp. C42_A2020_068]
MQIKYAFLKGGKKHPMKKSLPAFAPSPIAVTIVGIIWGLIAFYFGIIYGMPLPGEEVPQWYVILNYIFEGVAHLGVAWLCLIDWQLPEIISDRKIWLLFGLRSAFYFLANLIFGYWELILQRSPEVSLADPVYIVSYLLLLWGMILALRARRVTLKTWQYGVISAIIILGIWLGWISTFPPESSQAQLVVTSPVVEQTVIASNPSTTVAQDSAFPIAEKEAPEWVLGVEEMLKPSAEFTSLFYVVLDIILLVLAGTLVLTFWGGQFSRTWLVVTIAALLLYIADVRYAYVAARGNFETGGLLDTLWVFSTILFGIAAVLEYDLSTSVRRRRN